MVLRFKTTNEKIPFFSFSTNNSVDRFTKPRLSEIFSSESERCIVCQTFQIRVQMLNYSISVDEISDR